MVWPSSAAPDALPAHTAGAASEPADAEIAAADRTNRAASAPLYETLAVPYHG